MILFLYNRELEKFNIDFIDMIDDLVVQSKINIETFDFTPYDVVIIVNNFIRLGGINTNVDSFVKVMTRIYKKQVIYIYDGKEDYDVSQVTKSYRVNMSSLNSNTLKEIITGILPAIKKDNAEEILVERAIDIVDKFSYDKLITESGVIKMIINDYLNTKEKLIDLEMKLKTKEAIIAQKDKRIETLENEKTLYSTAYSANLDEYNKLKVLYEKLGFDKEQEKVVIDIDKYPKAPICIYLKEITHISYYTTFLEILHETIKTKLNLSTKIFRVVDKVFNKQLLSLPSEYYVGVEEYNTAKIITSEFILKQGEYAKALDILLNNNMDLDVLIISDETYLDYPIVEGDYLATFHLLKNYKEIGRYGLEPTSVISNDGTKEIPQWNYVNNFDSIKPSVLVYMLSEMSAITEILKTIEFIIESIGGDRND